MVVEKLAKGDRLTLVLNTEPEGKIRVQCYQWAEEPKVILADGGGWHDRLSRILTPMSQSICLPRNFVTAMS